MSHPIPGHEYGEELPNRKDVRLNSLQRAMGKNLKKAGQNLKRKGEGDLAYLKRIVGSKHKALHKKIPKYGRYGNSKPEMPGQSLNLPPGYKQSDLE